MELIGAVAVVLLTLVGYSSGIVVGKRGRPLVPGIGELPLIVLLWTGVFAIAGDSGRLRTIGVGFACGWIMGVIVATARRNQPPPARARRDREAPAVGFKGRWMTFATEMGNYQGRLLMAFFYFSAVTIFGLLVRFGMDPLRLRRSTPGWLSRPPTSRTLDDMRAQF